MATREQRRAKLAFDHVSSVAERREDERKQYATMTHRLPSLLVNAGLCQALFFVAARSEEPKRLLLDHLAAQLLGEGKGAKDLLNEARTAELAKYLWLSDEALVCAAWYRRMVQGVLKLEAGNADESTEGRA
ncbi:MAG: type III-B CRISPR module-associated protein Cmr5 [Myxococcales bacterium]|nr:type III-B CRISPR module-associated protein Cmr5 [Myxococcales bacterium]